MKNYGFSLWTALTALLMSTTMLVSTPCAVAMRKQGEQQHDRDKGKESDEENEAEPKINADDFVKGLPEEEKDELLAGLLANHMAYQVRGLSKEKKG